MQLDLCEGTCVPSAPEQPTPGGHPSGPPRRGTVRLLIDPTFGTFFWGKLLWATGMWIHTVVAAVAMFDLTGSTLLVGATGAAQFTPQLLLSAWAGKLADRGSPRVQILGGGLLGALGSGATAAWLLIGPSEHGQGWGIGIGTLAVGLGLAAGGPAMQSVVPSMVRPSELATAVELNTMPMTISRVAGPAIGALLIGTIGSDGTFAVAAACSTAFVLAVACIRLPRPTTTCSDDFSVRSALRFVRDDRRLLALLIGVTAVGFGADPSTTLAPALADALGGDIAWIGHVTSAYGVGAALGFIVMPPLRRRLGLAPLPSIGLAVIAAGLLGSATLVSRPVVLLAFAIGGIGMTIALTSISTQIHQRTPAYLRGRVMALWTTGFLGSRPVASLLTGLICDLTTVWVPLTVTALGVLAIAVLCRPGRDDAVPALRR